MNEDQEKENIWGKLKNFVTSNRKKIILLLALFVLIILPIVYLVISANNNSIKQDSLSKYSVLESDSDVSHFSLNAESGYLYKVSKTGQAAVEEFLKNNPTYNSNGGIFPQDFYKNSSLKTSKSDSTDQFLKKNNINISNEHYVFDQKINGIPIYGVNLTVHLKNKNEIYAVSGNLVKNQTIDAQKISDEEAAGIAFSEAKKDANEDALKVEESTKYYLNLKALGVSKDGKNYLTLAFLITGNNSWFCLFPKKKHLGIGNIK